MDPQAKDVDIYIEFAKAKGMEIKYVVDTHIQADHLSGGVRLALSECCIRQGIHLKA